MKLVSVLAYGTIGYLIYIAVYVFLLNGYKKVPLLLWQNNFIHGHEIIKCPSGSQCLVVGDIKDVIVSHEIKAFLFYGSLVNLEKLPTHDQRILWALFHEESPKNMPALRNMQLQRLFNITATFSQKSTLPLTLQYLPNLDSLLCMHYFLSFTEKNYIIKETDQAAILYLQSDCNTPIGRDDIVQNLMKFVKIDSYGSCLNNKKLPQELKVNGTYNLFDENLLRFVGRYKFVIAIENAICDDYITEKLWRPLIAGSIPIYLGSPTVKTWLPNEKSAILVENFATIESLANYIKRVNTNALLYQSFLNHKLKQQVSNKRLLMALNEGNFGHRGNFNDVVPSFQCFVCDVVHESRTFETNNMNVYDCSAPRDKSFDYSWQLEYDKVNALLQGKKINVTKG